MARFGEGESVEVQLKRPVTWRSGKVVGSRGGPGGGGGDDLYDIRYNDGGGGGVETGVRAARLRRPENLPKHQGKSSVQ